MRWLVDKSNWVYIDSIQEEQGDYLGATFNYGIFNIDGKKVIKLENVFTTNPCLIIPDEIKNIPVISIKLDDSMDKEGLVSIKMGNNVQEIISFTKHVKNLITIELKKDFKNFDLLPTLNQLGTQYSKLFTKISIDPNNPYLTETNGCITSKDKKIVYLIYSNGNVTLPKEAEVLESHSIPKIFSADTVITWPTNLKEVKDFAFDCSPSVFYTRNRFPLTLEKIGNQCIPEGKEYSDNVAYIEHDTLYISDKVNSISNRALGGIYCRYFKPNNNFLNNSKLIVSKDGKTLYRALFSKKDNALKIPESIENLKPGCFENNFIKKKVLFVSDRKLIGKIKESYPDITVIEKSKESESENYIDSTSIEKDRQTVPKYLLNRTSLKLAEEIYCDKLEIDINAFKETKTKTFVINNECRNIKELIIPEGVTNIELDPECFDNRFKLEILNIPSTCKFNLLLNELANMQNLMLVIINPKAKPKWDFHKLPYILACNGDFKMKKCYDPNIYASYYGYGSLNQEIIFNEITYINKFDRNKLVITDDAYYYQSRKKGFTLMKIRPIDNYVLPSKVDSLTVIDCDEYYNTKYKGKDLNLDLPTR